MDLRLFLHVLGRFKLLVLVGVLLAMQLAFFSMVNVSFDGGSPRFTYRVDEEWASYTQLRLDAPGAAPTTRATESPSDAERLSTERLLQDRLTNEAIFYARLVDSDPVRRLRARFGGSIPGRVDALPLKAVKDGDSYLPIIDIAGVAATPAASGRLATAATQALRAYMETEQERRGVPKSDRFVTAVVKRAGRAELFTPRPKTTPIVVFLTVLTLVIALAFILENLRPAVQPEAPSELVAAPDVERRRSASA